MLSKIREALVRWFGMDVKDSRPCISVVCVAHPAPTPPPEHPGRKVLGRRVSNYGVLYDDEGKVCTRCSTYKPYSSYHVCREGLGATQSWCKECMRAHGRARYAAEKKKKGAACQSK